MRSRNAGEKNSHFTAGLERWDAMERRLGVLTERQRQVVKRRLERVC